MKVGGALLGYSDQARRIPRNSIPSTPHEFERLKVQKTKKENPPENLSTSADSNPRQAYVDTVSDSLAKDMSVEIKSAVSIEIQKLFDQMQTILQEQGLLGSQRFDGNGIDFEKPIAIYRQNN